MSQLPCFWCLFLSCQQQKTTQNRTTVTSVRSFLFYDDFRMLQIFVSFPKKPPIWPLFRLLSSCCYHRCRCWYSWAKHSLSFHCCCWCTNAWRTYYATLLLPKIHPFDHRAGYCTFSEKKLALACARTSALLMILVTARPLVARARNGQKENKWPSQRSCVCVTHARARTYKSAPNM